MLSDKLVYFQVTHTMSLWNSLPVGCRHINLSIGQFRSALKTHLFN